MTVEGDHRRDFVRKVVDAVLCQPSVARTAQRTGLSRFLAPHDVRSRRFPHNAKAETLVCCSWTTSAGPVLAFSRVAHDLVLTERLRTRGALRTTSIAGYFTSSASTAAWTPGAQIQKHKVAESTSRRRPRPGTPCSGRTLRGDGALRRSSAEVVHCAKVDPLSGAVRLTSTIVAATPRTAQVWEGACWPVQCPPRSARGSASTGSRGVRNGPSRTPAPSRQSWPRLANVLQHRRPGERSRDQLRCRAGLLASLTEPNDAVIVSALAFRTRCRSWSTTPR